jgi:hypothetical protein
MGAEMTKWMIDSKVEDLHKKMPWRDDDDEGEKGQQQAADSIVDEFGQMFGQRTEEECEQGTPRHPLACASSRNGASPDLHHRSNRTKGDGGGAQEVAQGGGLAAKQVQAGQRREADQDVR